MVSTPASRSLVMCSTVSSSNAFAGADVRAAEDEGDAGDLVAGYASAFPEAYKEDFEG